MVTVRLASPMAARGDVCGLRVNESNDTEAPGYREFIPRSIYKMMARDVNAATLAESEGKLRSQADPQICMCNWEQPLIGQADRLPHKSGRRSKPRPGTAAPGSTRAPAPGFSLQSFYLARRCSVRWLPASRHASLGTRLSSRG